LISDYKYDLRECKAKTTKCPAISSVTAIRDVPAFLRGLLLLASLLLLTSLLLQACPIYVPVVAVDPADVIAVVSGCCGLGYRWGPCCSCVPVIDVVPTDLEVRSADSVSPALASFVLLTTLMFSLSLVLLSIMLLRMFLLLMESLEFLCCCCRSC
jgi:hypothetical protein